MELKASCRRKTRLSVHAGASPSIDTEAKSLISESKPQTSAMVLAAISKHQSQTAFLTSKSSTTVSYSDLLNSAYTMAATLKAVLKEAPEERWSTPRGVAIMGPRIGVMAGPSPEFASALLGAWMVGGVAVPLALSHPPKELTYVLQDAGICAVLASSEYQTALQPLRTPRNIPLVHLKEPSPSAHSPADISTPEANRGAVIIYTSGTTGRPKGAVHTHGSLAAQVQSLAKAWGWTSDDKILHVLPLHHIHGLVNALLCPLYVGAAVEFLPKFNPAAMWERWQRPPKPLKDGSTDRLTVFMGVPTMYVKLLQALEGLSPEDQSRAAKAVGQHRLMVSGSAACPASLMERWEHISSLRLLERYGMTEIGMALSNPLRGQRRPGYVGLPLPFVEAKVGSGGATEGELLIRGPTLFHGYWGRKEATEEAFTEDGWFKTGDTVVCENDGWYRILGRTSVDIIKSGGYKLSALEIEDALLQHPGIAECAVLGVPDEAYGEVVAAVLVAAKSASSEQDLSPSALTKWARSSLAPYKIPRVWRFIESMPRNAMGKVNKGELLKSTFP